MKISFVSFIALSLLMIASPAARISAATPPAVQSTVAPRAGVYSVYYRESSEEPWKKLGDFQTHEDAYAAAWKLESEHGYETFVKYRP